MKPLVAMLATVTLLVVQPVSAATVDFENEIPGTAYGLTAGDSQGDIVLVQDNIAMSVENFTTALSVYFFEATIGGQYQSFFPTMPLSVNNIDVRFDLTQVGFDVERVTMDFREFGGIVDFRVNDGPNMVLDSLADLPEDIAPGVTAIVRPAPDLGVRRLTLAGDLDSFRVGGQELAIDNVAAVPEPVTMLLLSAASLVAVRRRRTR